MGCETKGDNNVKKVYCFFCIFAKIFVRELVKIWNSELLMKYAYKVNLLNETMFP